MNILPVSHPQAKYPLTFMIWGNDGAYKFCSNLALLFNRAIQIALLVFFNGYTFQRSRNLVGFWRPLLWICTVNKPLIFGQPKGKQYPSLCQYP